MDTETPEIMDSGIASNTVIRERLASEMDALTTSNKAIGILIRILIELRECPPGVQEQACTHPDSANPPYPKPDDPCCEGCWSLWVTDVSTNES
jgi:hypothetical protein